MIGEFERGVLRVADLVPALDRLRSTGRRAGVDGGRAYQLTETLLLEDVCTPAGGAATV